MSSRSIAVYFDELHKCGIIVVDPAELAVRDTTGADKPISCALGVKTPEVRHGAPMLFLLDPEEAKILGEKLLFFAAEKAATLPPPPEKTS